MKDEKEDRVQRQYECIMLPIRSADFRYAVPADLGPDTCETRCQVRGTSGTGAGAGAGYPGAPVLVERGRVRRGSARVAAAAVLGCVGYGSVFLAVGLYLRNPIIPAAVLLAWESVNGILPHVVQKFSILYYLQSLCPVPAPMDDDAPVLIQLLAAPAAPASGPGAILGLLLLTAFVLWIAALAVRRMQISYGSET